MDEREIVIFRQRLLQHRRQAGVQFHRHHFAGPLTQLLGQGPDARPHLQHTGPLIDAGLLGNGRRHMGGAEKILPQPLGKMEPMLGQQPFDYADIRQIQLGSPLLSYSAPLPRLPLPTGVYFST